MHAIIKGPEGTPFVGGRFRLKLLLSHDYPSQPPRGFFLTKIYHPNVASNGDICVNTLKKDWTPETTLRHVLQVIRCLLIVPFPESSLNDEAGKLFMDSYDEFARRARISTDVHALADDDDEDCLEGPSSSSSSSSGSSGKCAAGEPESSTILGESAKGHSNVKKPVDAKSDAKKKSLKRL